MTYEEFEANVLQRSKELGMLEKITYKELCLYLIEAHGKLAAAWLQNNAAAAKAALGDISVVEVLRGFLETGNKQMHKDWGPVENMAFQLTLSGIGNEAAEHFKFTPEEWAEHVWEIIQRLSADI